jgi:hypothetical protein
MSRQVTPTPPVSIRPIDATEWLASWRLFQKTRKSTGSDRARRVCPFAAAEGGVKTREFKLPPFWTRDEIRDRTTKIALNLLRLKLIDD